MNEASVTEWRMVVGREGEYMVSDQGDVMSLKRKQARIMQPSINGGGYKQVMLGAKQTGRIAQLVLEAFVGPRPGGHEVAHNNGDRLDNRRCNLRWATRVSNHADKRKHGTHLQGETVPGAKLTADRVRNIRKMIAAGVSDTEVGQAHGVHRRTVNDIRRGKTWTHLKAE
jgi:hypothetical protein